VSNDLPVLNAEINTLRLRNGVLFVMAQDAQLGGLGLLDAIIQQELRSKYYPTIDARRRAYRELWTTHFYTLQQAVEADADLLEILNTKPAEYCEYLNLQLQDPARVEARMKGQNSEVPCPVVIITPELLNVLGQVRGTDLVPAARQFLATGDLQAFEAMYRLEVPKQLTMSDILKGFNSLLNKNPGQE